jgi:hypothetical protein
MSKHGELAQDAALGADLPELSHGLSKRLVAEREGSIADGNQQLGPEMWIVHYPVSVFRHGSQDMQVLLPRDVYANPTTAN